MIWWTNEQVIVRANKLCLAIALRDVQPCHSPMLTCTSVEWTETKLEEKKLQRSKHQRQWQRRPRHPTQICFYFHWKLDFIQANDTQKRAAKKKPAEEKHKMSLTLFAVCNILLRCGWYFRWTFAHSLVAFKMNNIRITHRIQYIFK